MEIERLTAERANDVDTLQMTIDVEADPEQTRLIEANLYKLVDILSVESHGSCADTPPADAPK
jgi:acetolactate synthase small subunit